MARLVMLRFSLSRAERMARTRRRCAKVALRREAEALKLRALIRRIGAGKAWQWVPSEYAKALAAVDLAEGAR